MAALRAGRRSDRAFLVLGLLAAGLAATWLDGARLRNQRQAAADRNLRVAGELGLTDICLFGDAPWLRHLSGADVLGSMQDIPGGFDFTRSGSIVGPPGMPAGIHAIVAEPPTVLR